MEVKVLSESKEEVQVELSNLTIAEILRVYLNKDSNVSFAAWKRDHYTKNPTLTVRGKDPKKALKSAVDSITKDLDSVSKDFSSLK